MSTSVLARIGNDFGVGSSQGVMPYLRAAYEWNWNPQALHVGALYMQSNVNPVDRAPAIPVERSAVIISRTMRSTQAISSSAMAPTS